MRVLFYQWSRGRSCKSYRIKQHLICRWAHRPFWVLVIISEPIKGLICILIQLSFLSELYRSIMLWLLWRHRNNLFSPVSYLPPTLQCCKMNMSWNRMVPLFMLFGRSPDLSGGFLQIVRCNPSSGSWVCLGVTIQWDVLATSVMGANHRASL